MRSRAAGGSGRKPRAPAQTPPASPAAQKAEQLYQAKDFAGAEKAYLAVTQSEPDNAFAWFRVATALQAEGQYQQSLPYLDKAEKAGYPAGAILYRRAKVAAKANDKDKAFDYLNQLATAGFAQVSLLQNDPDFASLKDDPRFAKAIEEYPEGLTAVRLRALTTANSISGSANGTWSPPRREQPVGASSIQLILGNCVILENWTGGGWRRGKKLQHLQLDHKKMGTDLGG